jgi:hypothetical protein
MAITTVIVYSPTHRVATFFMTGLMDKIRAVLGRREPQPRDANEALGSPSSAGGEVSAGEPTLGSARGMDVGTLARGGEPATEPYGGPPEELDR